MRSGGCSVAYYFIYALTVGGAIYAYRKRRMPAHRPGDFSLNRWFVPVAVAAFLYAAAVIVIALTRTGATPQPCTYSGLRSSGSCGTCCTCASGSQISPPASCARRS